jgi:competence protein ComEC
VSAAGIAITPDAVSAPNESAEPRRTFGRYPLVSLALAMSVGIVVDRMFNLDPRGIVVVSAIAVAVFLTAIRARWTGVSAAAVLVLCAAGAAFHHHLAWWSVPANDVGWHLQQGSVLMKIRGRVAERPAFFPARNDARRSAIPQTDVTRFAIHCEAIVTLDGTIPVAGSLRAAVSGLLPGLTQGDTVTVLSEASGLPGAGNPGEFDVADSLKRQGLRGTIRINDAALVEVTRAGLNPVSKMTGWLRGRCETALQRSLGETSLPIASALLLGDRSMISRGVRSSFIESGTMHLLAISGLHIGILTAFIFACCRVCGLSGRHSVVAVLALLTIYLGVADLRPPVIRACVLVSIWGVGKLLRRPSFSGNSLAAAAMIVLALNPSDLFDVGAQLSFLAVAAILWLIAVRKKPDQADVAADPDGDRAAEVLLPRWRQLLLPVQRWLWSAYQTTGLIWLLTMPLVASAFNVVSLTGLVVNVLLIPFVGVALCIGFVSLALGVVDPHLGMPFGFVFDGLLRLLLWAVQAAARVEFGHFYVPPPPQWWLLGLYSLVASAMLWAIARRRSRWVWSGAILWTIFGISIALQPVERTGLRCTFLSVGHGLSVLIETPSGRTLLYDAGSLANGQTATRAVEQTLWEHGYRQIDAVVISHADIDHYNGVAPLFETFTIHSIRYSSLFVDESQEGTVEIRDLALRDETELKEVVAGDSIRLDPDVTISVLHPETDASYGSDNAGSVALQIEYRGRRILLTGDLENEGLWSLLAKPKRKVDVLLSPHHGSLAANPLALAEWCEPSWIVASSGRRFPGNRLRDQYGHYGSRVLSTSEEGAIEFTISPAGEISRKSWRRTSDDH